MKQTHDKTRSLSTEEAQSGRRWVVVDAAGKTLGRLATQVAHILRGKDNPMYTPHVDSGAFVVVVNAAEVVLTGKKETDKLYHHHTGWVGGLKTTNAATLRAQHPERLVEKAVWGMLPKGPLGRAYYRKLKVYGGSEHPHEAQKPEAIELAA